MADGSTLQVDLSSIMLPASALGETLASRGVVTANPKGQPVVAGRATPRRPARA